MILLILVTTQDFLLLSILPVKGHHISSQVAECTGSLNINLCELCALLFSFAQPQICPDRLGGSMAVHCIKMQARRALVEQGGA